MIRGNPMHDTVNPPGQFTPPKYLRDIITRVEVQEGIKATYSLQLSQDCSEQFARTRQETREGVEATTPLDSPENGSGAVLGPLASSYLEKYGFVNWQAQEIAAKMEGLCSALLAYCQVVGDTQDRYGEYIDANIRELVSKHR